MKTKMIIVAAFAAAALAVQAEDPKSRVIRRLEALNVENVRMAWADMAARWPDRFEKDPEWLRTLDARRKRLLSAIMGDWGPFYGEPAPQKGGELLLEEVRGHLLENPLHGDETSLGIFYFHQNLLGNRRDI